MGGGGGVGSGVGVGLGVQGRCEQRREVFQRSEVFVKIKKKMCGGGGVGSGGGVRLWRVRVDVNEELKFL